MYLFPVPVDLLYRIPEVQGNIIVGVPGKGGHAEVIGRFAGKVFTEMDPVIGRKHFFSEDRELEAGKVPGQQFLAKLIADHSIPDDYYSHDVMI